MGSRRRLRLERTFMRRSWKTLDLCEVKEAELCFTMRKEIYLVFVMVMTSHWWRKKVN